MGCSSSAPAEKIAPMERPVGSSGTYLQIMNEKCPHIRVDCCKETKSLRMQGKRYNYNLNYCYVSQRGYYPHALNKANQDSYIVCENILGDPFTHLFGIFDGHGEFGDYCSHFAAAQVPMQFEKILSQNYSGIDTFNAPEIDSAYSKAFIDANIALHNSSIDDSLSGTTGITVVVRGDTLLVANVGDSRAILAREEDGRLVYAPLSSDQTPYRKDERDRIKKLGGRVMTLEQIEGNEPIHENWGTENGESIDEIGDPPRIWDDSLERPGCAFTRSLGDNVAEQVGVNAEPEILTWKLTSSDRLIIIASDGVFEFLTSQAVVDILNKFDDPIKGAKNVIAESYRLWLTYDERTDDISIIVIVIKDMQRVKTANSPIVRYDSTAAVASHRLAIIETKPVRSMMSKAKRKIIMDRGQDNANEVFDVAANTTPKSAEELLVIEQIVRSNFMFSRLSQKHKDMIYQVMKLRQVKSGELVIKEGDPGDEMYIVNSGEFVVFKRDENGVTQEILTYNTPGCAFGELSLMYGEPRAASVRAKTDGSLWSIHRLAFRTIIMSKRKKGLLTLLRKLRMFADISYTKLQRICEMSTEANFLSDEIVASGTNKETAWIICVVLDGQVRLKSTSWSTKDKVKEKGTFFVNSEIGSVYSMAKADGSTSVLFVPATGFKEIIGKQDRSLSLLSNESEMMRPVAASPVRMNSILRSTSMWSPEMFSLQHIEDRSDCQLVTPLHALGDYAYLANFRFADTGKTHTATVLAKKRTMLALMDNNMLKERMLLASLQGNLAFIPRLISLYQDEKIVMFVFEDHFVCDLAAACTYGMTDDAKRMCFACMFNALVSLHDKGIMHRLVNPGSIFITASGIPKLVGLRYAKLMDGVKAYTICGDPLYFAPEMIGQQGYDYAVDIWSFGVMVYEMYEGRPPFGTEDTDQTTLFRSITSFLTGDTKLSFTKTPPDARELVSATVKGDSSSRLGYEDSKEVEMAPYFTGIDWNNLNNGAFIVIKQAVAGDPSIVFDETELEPFASEVFAKF